jgi:hypothetical protein
VKREKASALERLLRRKNREAQESGHDSAQQKPNAQTRLALFSRADYPDRFGEERVAALAGLVVVGDGVDDDFF